MDNKSIFKYSIRIFISIAALFVVFYNIDGTKFFEHIVSFDTFNLVWLFSIGFSIWLVRSFRLKIILSDVGNEVSFISCFQALSVETLGNSFLPLRAGDLARCYSLSKTMGNSSVSHQIGAYTLEKLLDLVSFLLIVVGYFLIYTPEMIKKWIGMAIGVFIVSFILGLLIFKLLKNFMVGLPFFKKAEPFLIDSMRGFKNLNSKGRFLEVCFYTLSVRFLAGLFFFIILVSLDIDITFMQAVFLSSLVMMSSLIPAAPGFIGTYELIAVFGLGLFLVDKTTAISFAILAHIAQLFIWMIIGIMGLSLTGNYMKKIVS